MTIGQTETDQGLDNRVHQLLNRTIAFAALLTPDGRVRDVSDSALQAAGITLADVAGRPFWDGYWFSYDTRLQDRIRASIEAAARGETSRFDYAARIVGDGRLIVDFQMAPIHDDRGRVVELLASGFDVTEREESKKRVEAALREASHRIKNLFATVRAMARLTRQFSRPEQALDDFVGRLEALATAHRVLGAADRLGWARFDELAREVLKPYLSGMENRITIVSGDRGLFRDQAKLLGLCLHELVTNSLKHGALSPAGGRIEVGLTDPSADGRATFHWTETRVTPAPAAAPDTRRQGYGLHFLRSTLGGIFQAEVAIDIPPGGLSLSVTGMPAGLFERSETAESAP